MVQTSLLERIREGQTLIADGATGTNLFDRGLPRGKSNEHWVLENPAEISKLHREFINAGADILLTCTFGANPYRLAENKLAGSIEEINRKAVDLANESTQEREVLVAASIGPLGKLIKPYGVLEPQDVAAAYTQQVEILSQTKIDFFVIETQFDIDEAKYAVEAVQSASDLPIVVSFSFDRGTRTMMGVRPSQMAETFSQLGVDILGINCGRSLEDNQASLQELREATDLPIWFKPNAGLPSVDSSGNSVYDLTPNEMGEHAKQWVTAGASIIGGCCGTTPDHLKAIANATMKETTT